MEFIAKQIPYVLPWDKMPVDISFIFENEKPAGKHGFLKIEGENFVFEDGTPAKFWGTNFNSGANFPSHSHSEKVAKRLGGKTFAREVQRIQNQFLLAGSVGCHVLLL